MHEATHLSGGREDNEPEDSRLQRLRFHPLVTDLLDRLTSPLADRYAIERDPFETPGAPRIRNVPTPRLVVQAHPATGRTGQERPTADARGRSHNADPLA